MCLFGSGGKRFIFIKSKLMAWAMASTLFTFI